MARKKHDAAQITAKHIHDLVRQRALAVIGQQDEVLASALDKAAAGIRRDLRAIGFTQKEVRAVLEKHLGGSLAERVAVVEKAIRDAAKTARGLDQKTFEAVFGAEEVAKSPRPFALSSAPTRMPSSLPDSGSEDE